MVVIAIIAIIAAIAIPNLLKARASANEASAISSMRTLVSSQAMFYQDDLDEDGTSDYAESREELASEDLIDTILGHGTKSGYRFAMRRPDKQRWETSATPEKPGYTGFFFYFVDETEVVRSSEEGKAREEDQPIDETGNPTPTPRAAAKLPEKFASLAIQLIQRLDNLLEGDAVGGAQNILRDPLNVEFILAELDRNDDGHLTWAEVLGTDYLARARNVIPLLSGLPTPTPGAEERDDESPRKKLRAYQRRVSRGAKFCPSEQPLPGVPTTALDGDPVAFLEGAR